MADSDGASVPNNENNKKVSREDIELVRTFFVFSDNFWNLFCEVLHPFVLVLDPQYFA